MMGNTVQAPTRITQQQTWLQSAPKTQRVFEKTAAEGGAVAESVDGKTAKKTDGFQVKTKLVTKKDLDLFFKPRSSAQRSDQNDPKSRRFENLSP